MKPIYKDYYPTRGVLASTEYDLGTIQEVLGLTNVTIYGIALSYVSGSYADDFNARVMLNNSGHVCFISDKANGPHVMMYFTVFYVQN